MLFSSVRVTVSIRLSVRLGSCRYFPLTKLSLSCSLIICQLGYIFFVKFERQVLSAAHSNQGYHVVNFTVYMPSLFTTGNCFTMGSTVPIPIRGMLRRGPKYIWRVTFALNR